jgi:integrase
MDNYVCLNIKVLRTFFNFLIVTKGYEIGGFFKEFYSRHEEIPIIVLNHDQLRFLIKNQDFELKLSKNQLIIKDILVIGCTVGLRFSDLMALQIKNIEEINCCTYIVTKSIKTKTFTRVKVPNYVIELIEKYKQKHKRLIPSFSLNYFNQQLKLIGEIAGWTFQIGKCRSKKGYQKEIIKTDGKEYRFCDLLSSHVMRRTAITTMLNFGMPETLVRRISGHTANSAEFYKYVKYSEAFIDSETDKVFEKLNA